MARAAASALLNGASAPVLACFDDVRCSMPLQVRVVKACATSDRRRTSPPPWEREFWSALASVCMTAFMWVSESAGAATAGDTLVRNRARRAQNFTMSRYDTNWSSSSAPASSSSAFVSRSWLSLHTHNRRDTGRQRAWRGSAPSTRNHMD